MARTPPVRTAAPRVEVEPRHRKLRPAATVETLHPVQDASPRWRETAGRQVAGFASLLLHPLQHRFARVAVEERWHPHGFAAGSTAARIADASPADLGGEDNAEEKAAAVDRHWAVATMIGASILAVAVSVVVAPRLRNADLPVYTESSALVQQGAEIYASTCAACHGADLKGTAGQGFGPPPLDGSGHAWLHSDTTLFRMVKFGIANCLPGNAAQPQMPSFGKELDDRSIHAALTYIKSRWPTDIRVVQNAFNDGESDSAETQEAVLCTAICLPPSSNASSSSTGR